MHKTKMRDYVFTKNHTVSYVIDDQGVFSIDALGHLGQGVYVITPDVAAEIVRGILAKPGHIKHIRMTGFAPEVTRMLSMLKRVAFRIEAAVLNPHTELGRKRIMREFELVVSDD